METEVVPILRVADADAAVRWYERLGFTKQWEHRFDPDCPAFASSGCLVAVAVAAGAYRG